MPWHKPLPKPVTLVGGRVLRTLADARLVLSQPHLLRDPAVQQALMLMIEAVESGDDADLQAAADRVIAVLALHKLLP